MDITVDVIVEELFLEAGLRGNGTDGQREQFLKQLQKTYSAYKQQHRAKNAERSCSCCGSKVRSRCLACQRPIATEKLIAYARETGSNPTIYTVHELCLDRAVKKAAKEGVTLNLGKPRDETIVIRGKLPEEITQRFTGPDPDFMLLRDEAHNIIGIEVSVMQGSAKEVLRHLYENVLKSYHFRGRAYATGNGKEKVLWEIR